jgi:hypothetical protein
MLRKKFQVTGFRLQGRQIQLPVIRYQLPGNEIQLPVARYQEIQIPVTGFREIYYRLQVSGKANTVPGYQIPVAGE